LFGASQSGSVLQVDAAGYAVASPIIITGGQMTVTASSATSASFAESASFATTASYALSASFATTSSWSNTASFAHTASSVNTLNQGVTISGSFTVFTGSAVEFQVHDVGVKIGNIITDTHQITGSLIVSGSIIGSLFGTASFATTAYDWNTPTVAIQGDPIFFVNNSSSTYGTATRMPMTSLTTTFIEGSMATGALGIQPGATGVYEIRMDGFVLDSGGNPTLLTCYIGVNGTARAQRLHTVPTSAYANFSISCVSSLNGGEIIDFRFGSSGGERIDIDGVSIFVRRIA
jgi:hypothetical protein